MTGGWNPLIKNSVATCCKVVDLMYQRGSIIVVSQLPVENWYKMIGDSHADAILDRLVHGIKLSNLKENQCGKYNLR